MLNERDGCTFLSLLANIGHAKTCIFLTTSFLVHKALTDTTRCTYSACVVTDYAKVHFVKEQNCRSCKKSENLNCTQSGSDRKDINFMKKISIKLFLRYDVTKSAFEGYKINHVLVFKKRKKTMVTIMDESSATIHDIAMRYTWAYLPTYTICLWLVIHS